MMQPEMLAALGGEDNKGEKDWAKVVELIAARPDAAKEKSECHGAIPLRYAASREAPLNVFETILEAYPDGVKQTDDDRSLPLHYANTADIARLLLEAYPDGAKQTNRYKRIPLHNAKTADIARVLLEAYPDGVKQTDDDRSLPLHYANTADIARLLLEAYPDGAKQTNHYKQIPLHKAKTVDIARLLLEAYPDGVKQTDDDRSLPLHYANTADIARLLLEAYPDGAKQTNRKSHYKQIPLHKAKTVDIARLLLEAYPDGVKQTDADRSLPLHYANTADIAHLLLEAYPDGAKQTNHYKQIPLHKAKTVDIARLLLEAYPDGVKPDDDRSLPLHYANTADIAHLLLEAYPEGVKQTNHYKQIPLHNAKTADIARVLLEAYPDGVKQTDDYRSLPLHYANTADIARLLLEAYPDGAKQAQKIGRLPLPLHMAIEKTLPHVARVLLEAYPEGAKQADEDGRLPLHTAVDSYVDPPARYRRIPLHFAKTAEIVRLLLEAYPDGAKQADEDGRLPLYRAVDENLPDIARAILEFCPDAASPDAASIAANGGELPLNMIAEWNDDQEEHLELCQLAYNATSPDLQDYRHLDRKGICLASSINYVHEWAKSLGTKYKRYKLETPVRPIYRSKTCEVYFAQDVEQTPPAPVCIKMIRDAINFESEQNSREKVVLDPAYVVEVVRFLDDTKTRAFRDTTTGAPSWEANADIDEYAMVMPRADRNLHGVIADERIAGHEPHKVRPIAIDVANALQHLHEKGLVHGDIKPRNIVRVVDQWKLIDLDASASIGDPIGRKYSSGYSPPELAKMLFTKNGESIDTIHEPPSQVTLPPQPPPQPPKESSPHKNLRAETKLKMLSIGSFKKRKLLAEARATFDVWGFGCVLYQLCAGRPLFSDIDSSDDNIYKATTARQLMQWTEIDNERLSYVFEGHDKDADDARDLIRQCLRGNPSERLASMTEVLAHPFLGGKSVGTRGGGGGSKKKQEWNSTDVYPDGSYAVIIAIDKYENAGIPVNDGGFENLNCTVKDAKLMREALAARGFTILGELLNEQATMPRVKKLMSTTKKALKGKMRSRFVFFLASHGYLEEGEAWMCCYGADRGALEETCIDLNELKKMSKRLDSSHQLFVLDCCHAGGLFAGTRGAPTKYEQAMMRSPAIYGMTAVTEDQEALESEVTGHGFFTQSVVHGLNGKAPEFDRGEPYITATQLFSYAQKRVFQEAEEKERIQTPKFEPLVQMHKDKSCDGQFLFFANPTANAVGSATKAVKGLR
eukprot:Stramenopile-MAST_4_protein_583